MRRRCAGLHEIAHAHGQRHRPLRVLPDGVVKGGSSIKMRYGDAATRFTTDLDMATAMDADLNMERLNDRLRQGWEGFTGRVVRKDPASPKDVPEEYVMQPAR